MTPQSNSENYPISIYEELLAQMQAKLYAYILAMVANPADAKDVLQETNRVIFLKVGELKESDRFSSWSYRIAYFQSLSHIKKRKKHRGLQSLELLENVAALSETVGRESEGRMLKLEQCLEKLRESTRSIVVDYYFRNRPLKEIASSLGMTPNRVGQIMFRARKALYDCMTLKERNEDG